MTFYAGNRSITSTMNAASVDTVILSQPCRGVTVTNVTGTAPLYFTVSHPGGANAQPTVGGNDYVVPNAYQPVRISHDGQFGSIVNLISASVCTYNVAVTT